MASLLENSNSLPIFKYWGGIKARNLYVGFLLAMFNLLDSVHFKTNYPWPGTDEWNNLPEKDLSPCKQLPCLEDGDVYIGESFAILRYFCKRFDLNPTDLKQFALSEQQMQWADSIHVILSNAHYAQDRKKSMDELFADNGKIYKMLSGLNKSLLSNRVPGDYVAAAALCLLVDLQQDCLDKHENVKVLYDEVMSNEKVKTYLESVPNSYFKRE